MQPGNNSSQYDVVIVGFGPSGAVAACWLGQAGIRTLVIDKRRTIWEIPRAIAVDHEILRVFQNIGAVEKVLPYTAPFPASEHFGAKGQLIRRIDAVPPPYPLGYVPTMVFSQPPVEAILRARAGEHASVTVVLGLEAIAVTQTAQQVTLQLRDEDGQIRSVTAAYVIACDGASSPIRQLLNLRLEDLGFDEPWMVVDVRMNEASLAKLPKTAAQYCDPARPTTFIVGPGNHRRWEIMLLPDENPLEMESKSNVWRLLSPWITPQDGELWRASSYRFHALVAAQWRKGRVFLAGDAAHQQPPFIGQGMCQGIRDVSNLAWKLETVLAGQADESLLDTYAEERCRHVHSLTARIKAIGHHICERDPEAARRRDESLLEQGGGTAPTVTRQEIVPPLETGLLSGRPHPANGTLFSQPWIVSAAEVKHMDDVVGHGWRLVIDGRKVTVPVELSPSPVTSVIIGGPGLREQDAILSTWFDRHNCVAAVVRPDHYVYGVVERVEEIAPVLAILRNRLAVLTH
jgi:3-(3-hydroxy-phenyl)propionate hydroxylase